MRNERLHVLSDRPGPTAADLVLYWMQASVRVDDNQALNFAASEASRLRLPLIVFFGIVLDYPDASVRHYKFLFDGLKEVEERLKDMNIRFIIGIGNPADSILELSRRAVITVLDCGYTRIQRQWRHTFALRTPGPAVMVEDNVCLPVLTAYSRSAIGARVIRPGIEKSRDVFLSDSLQPPGELSRPPDIQVECVPASSLDSVLVRLNQYPLPVDGVAGGGRAAREVLEHFLNENLGRYEEHKNEPAGNAVSRLSPYIHFGQISVREIARAVLSEGGPGAEAFLEELLVRRELAVNFLWFNSNYESPEVLPKWSVESLDAHSSDSRPYIYDEKSMELSQTHDPYWNACMSEMVHTGYMHGYMRMYWGKKVIEWTRSWRDSWNLLIKWNNMYELDGRDPNGYAGVAWCFGMHDRPWGERAVFGNVRYMNDKGLERKFDMDAYVRDVQIRVEK